MPGNKSGQPHPPSSPTNPIASIVRSVFSHHSPPLSNFATMPVHESIPRAPSYFRRAARAASYPLRGIGHFVRTKEFWPLFLSRLLPLSVISLIVYFILFVFAFLPQYAFLAIFHGRGAWVNAVVLVLGEGLVIIQGLFEGFFVDECRVDVYDVSIVNWKCGISRKLTAAGNTHPERLRRSRRTTPHHFRRCTQRRQDAGQAHFACDLPTMEHHPNSRTDCFLATEFGSDRGHACIHHHHRHETRQAVQLPLVPASRTVQGRTKERDEAT